MRWLKNPWLCSVACGVVVVGLVAQFGPWRSPPEPEPSPGSINATPVPKSQIETLSMQELLTLCRDTQAKLLREVHDYSAVLVKRERFKGKLGPEQTLFVKVRHEPYSVFLHFLAPEKNKGDEAIYVEGQNDGKLLGHTTGVLGWSVGTVQLDPLGSIAMNGQNHPITHTGLAHLIGQFVEFAEKNLENPRCQVERVPGAKVGDRPATCVRIIGEEDHPKPRRHLARVFIDDATGLPIRYEKYESDLTPDAKPELMEEYTWLKLKLNPGLTDLDFDRKNPGYKFP